ncbi:hypothetical protein [Azomonas macrocytogenes]|uniref:Putative lipoprotein n=1 Tax=Azomonas macrocytogenes TaxID=69962 RepID=A0A839SZF2_AZOMA|nr:hypothetical protein [Azomonas macrocytogenes]MBB3102268.1 putative lipoprotein [Azomonas macrocytogenes]
MSFRHVLYAMLVPLLASCQSTSQEGNPHPLKTGDRWQGELLLEQDRLWLEPCSEGRRFLVLDGLGLDRDARTLMASQGTNSLFVDLRGRMAPTTEPKATGLLTPTRLYRLEDQNPGCKDPELKGSLMRARIEPDLTLTITSQGMLLQRSGQPPQALPYLEEQLPEGQTNFSSEANGQRLELWIAPQRCQGNTILTPLAATLQMNGRTLRGCAYLGGGRE